MSIFFSLRDVEWQGRAPRTAHIHGFSGKKPTAFINKKTGKKLTSARVVSHQTLLEFVKSRYTCRPLNGYETTMNFSPLKLWQRFPAVWSLLVHRPPPSSSLSNDAPCALHCGITALVPGRVQPNPSTTAVWNLRVMSPSQEGIVTLLHIKHDFPIHTHFKSS